MNDSGEIRLLKVSEAARALGVGRSTAYLMITDGELPVIDVRRKGSKIPRLRVDPEDLRKLIDSRRLAAA